MRQALALMLVVGITVLAVPVSAHHSEPHPNLKEIMSNIPAEVERFLAARAEEQVETDGEPSVLLGLRQIPPQSEIAVILESRDRYVGRLEASAQNADGFRIRTNNGEREIVYDDVESYTLIKLEGWAPPQVALGILPGQRIDVRFHNGRQTKGRLASATSAGFWLENNPTMLAFDEVDEIKYGRGPARKIVLIAAGAFAAFVVISFLALDWDDYPVPLGPLP